MDNQSKQVVITKQHYTNKEVALALGIGITTFRKWCLLLEQKGYEFMRDSFDRILYREQDLLTFHKIKELTANKRMTLDIAMQEVVAGIHQMERLDPTILGDRFDMMESQIVALLDRMEKQEQTNQELAERLDNQQRFIEMNIKARDHHLMKALKDIQETRMQMAAMSNEKKNRWSSFTSWFSKKS